MMSEPLNYLRIGSCIFLMICIVQAFYYPFLSSPEITAEWWQVGSLAGIGYLFGLPVFLLAEYLFESSLFREIFAWIASLIWVGMFYLFFGVILRLLTKTHNKSPKPTQ